MANEQTEEPNQKSPRNAFLSDHLANERTFLAWIRTSVGIMAFGFVVVKFSLFVKQLSFVLEKSIPYSGQGYTSVFGVSLVGFGALIGLLAFFRYKMIEKQLSDPRYRPSATLPTILTFSILLAGAFLVIYLLLSI
jgi:uncharacterized membrane protein YidH (DUF202 family)